MKSLLITALLSLSLLATACGGADTTTSPADQAIDQSTSETSDALAAPQSPPSSEGGAWCFKTSTHCNKCIADHNGPNQTCWYECDDGTVTNPTRC